MERQPIRRGATTFAMGIAIGLMVLLTIAATACRSEGAAVPDRDEREVGVYSAVLDWLIADAGMIIDATNATDDDDAEPADLFVASRSEAPIDVDVQVMLVDLYLDRVPLRFVDVWTEAVLEDEPDQPIHDGGMLVGLGAVEPDGDVIEVYADRYFSATRSQAWVLTLERSADDWQISGEPIDSDIRPFVDDS